MDKFEKKLPGVKKNILLKDHTTYKIGGPAKYFFIANSKEDLINALKLAKNPPVGGKLPVFILGGGSKVLISDRGFKGMVIKIQISGVEIRGDKIYVGAGNALANFSYAAAENGFSGFEWAAGIPGATVGGSIYGNAQAFGDKISDYVESVEALDLKTLKIENFSRKQCQFSLKNSIFKKKNNLIILSAVFRAMPGDKKEIKEKIEKFLVHRQNFHPLKYSSAGSTFVNPEIVIKNKKLLSAYPEFYEFNKTGVVPAAFLIEKSGLRGKKIGEAQISEQHANFIVNLGGAKARDVMALVKLAQKKVKKIFNIKLEPEVRFIGF